MSKLLIVPAAAVLIGLAAPAHAIPAFARKYGTSCLTCHTIYPKLNPFGEAFRRNGYRFPGKDSDFVKQETVALGQEAYKKSFPNAVWPGTLPSSVPLAIGFNGQAVVHPSKVATGTQADGGQQFGLDSLVEEAHLWAGGSFDDSNTFWGELTVADGGAEIERAQVLFNDLVGPAHAVNLVVGRGIATISSFGPHSSYIGDTQIPSITSTALFGAQGDSFNLLDNYNGAEVNGVLGGRLDYAVGIRQSVNNGISTPPLPNDENAYAHVGYKFGGLRMDGEGGSGPADPLRPWEETALTLEAFAFHSSSRFEPAADLSTVTPGPAGLIYNQDTALTVGGGFRLQLGSWELNSGIYQDGHNHVQADWTKGTVVAQYNELDYVLYPWLVPGLRFEHIEVNPENGLDASANRIEPGVAFLIRPNIKLVVAADIQSASPFGPPAGWGAAGTDLSIAPTDTAMAETETITAMLAAAF